MIVSSEQIKAVMPLAKKENIEKYLPTFNKYAEVFDLNTPLRVQHFLAQISVESCQLSAVVENFNYSAKGLRTTFGKYFPTDAMAASYARQPQRIASRVYANRMGNGNEASGDGWKYRGRGIIQLTGKNNYTKYKEYCGYDVVSQPDLLAGNVGAMRSAMWFWWSSGCNALADKDDVVAVTKRVNGGTNGLQERKAALDRAKKIIK